MEKPVPDNTLEPDTYEEPIKPNLRDGRNKTIRVYSPIKRGDKVLKFKWVVKTTNKSLRKNMLKITTDMYHLEDNYQYYVSSLDEFDLEAPSGRLKVPKHIVKWEKWNYCTRCDSHCCKSFDDYFTRNDKRSLKNNKFSSKPSRRAEKKFIRDELKEID